MWRSRTAGTSKKNVPFKNLHVPRKMGHILVLPIYKVNQSTISSQTGRTIMNQGFLCGSSSLRVVLSYSFKEHLSHQEITLKGCPRKLCAFISCWNIDVYANWTLYFPQICI